MLRRSSFLLLVSLAGCQLDDLTVTSDESAVSKSTLTSIGFTCETVSFNNQLCKKCNQSLCIYYQCVSGECTRCGTLAGDPPCVGLAAKSEQFFFFEAEAGAITAPQTKTTNAAGASNGGAVVLPAGSTTSGQATYSFSAGVSSTFYAWLRVRSSSTATSSFAVQFDNTAVHAWTPATGSAWQWVRVESLGQPIGTTLTAGSHTFKLFSGTPGTYVDRVLVTDNATFTPFAATYEAESAAYAAPMVKGSTSPYIGGVTYLWVPNGSPAGGSLQKATPVPYSGTYFLWGRVNAPTSADNSFYVSANFSEPVNWSIPVTDAAQWKWTQATANGTSEPVLLPIQEGAYGFVQIDRREDGTKLDKLLITNDPGFKPVDISITNGPW